MKHLVIYHQNVVQGLTLTFIILFILSCILVICQLDLYTNIYEIWAGIPYCLLCVPLANAKLIMLVLLGPYA